MALHPRILKGVCVFAALAGDDGWPLVVQPEVRAIEGRGHGPDSTLVFRCVSQGAPEGCEADLHQDQRYRLEGNPREHDLSLRINSATLLDSGRYYCHLQIQGKDHSEKMGTRVRVEAPPKILSVALEGGADGGFSAVCRVEGSPLPDVQWLEAGVGGRGSEGAWPRDSEGASPSAASPFHAVARLQDAQPQTHYTCAATNPLGRDQATLYFLRPLCTAAKLEPLTLLLSVTLGSKLAALLGAGLWMARRGSLQRLLWCGGE
uniref:Ig-like domain-containing protein n=1 Tax=Neogobius melanostomus TaxID=47308 RepID=A0A8C6SGX9_9GOBI